MDSKPDITRIAIIGPGKIAQDQHIPAINAAPDFKLVATVAKDAPPSEYPSFPSVSALMASGIAVDAAAICTPPQVRGALAKEAIDAGLDVLLEKPPAMTYSAFQAICDYASAKDAVLFTAWHSRFAAMVEHTREELAKRGLKAAQITWREDAQHWHPGQTWLWEPGGLGVFDPGINALSIFTRICDAPIVLTQADFEVPCNWHAPIAAKLALKAGDAAVSADFDFRQKGPQSWDIALECADGTALLLGSGGSTLSINGQPVDAPPKAEYPGVYERFAALIARRESDADGTPLQLVADAFLIARTEQAERFEP